MQTVKINFCGFWSSFNKKENLFTIMLSRHFDVEISENPDFVICSNRGNPFEYMKYDCVRIMFMGENMSPDFTVFDYCIGFDYMEFGDRYFRMPFGFYFNDAKPWIPEMVTEEKAREILASKKYFCNFIYGHRSSHGMREMLFETLSKYNEVVSPGSFLNNTGGKCRCSWAEKNEYLKYSKFTIACESIKYPGFVTEKIIQPFQQHSIPIYFGSTRIEEDINPDSFVWCKSESDVNSAVERIIELDKNDEAYIAMLMECPFDDVNKTVKIYNELDDFLLNIFSQNKESAYRRVKYYCAENHERFLREYMVKYKKTPQLIRKIKGI